MKVKSQIPSPCISVCTIDEDTGYCKGCFRNVQEIAGWDNYSDHQKIRLHTKLKKRKAKIKKEVYPGEETR